ncbi:MAG: hypothetical protein JKP98_20900 [Rhodobacteraceae bacterium]|nr:hypothetical protein [Paracoccaceae bacterium]
MTSIDLSSWNTVAARSRLAPIRLCSRCFEVK